MEWGGKLVGGVAGLLVGGPVGAALGLLAGHLFDDKLAEQRRTGRREDGGGRNAGGAERNTGSAERNTGGDAPRGAPQSAARPQSAKGERASTIYHVEDTDPLVGTRGESAATEEREDGPATHDPAAVSTQFFRTTFEVMGHVAKSDGRVSEDDIRAARSIMADFALDAPQVAQAIDNFNVGKGDAYDIEREVLALRRACAGRPDLLRNFLEIQMRAAIGGSDLRGPARPLLTRVAAVLGVGGLEFARLETVLRIRYRARGNRGDAADWNRPADTAQRTGHGATGGARPAGGASSGGASSGGASAGGSSAGAAGKGGGAKSGAGRAGEANGRGGRSRHSRRERPRPDGGATGGSEGRGPTTSGTRMSLSEAYEVLGVLPGARMPEITKAYRRQLSRHHPDKLKANGLPESMLAHAQQQTQLIIEAFNIIRESRGERA